MTLSSSDAKSLLEARDSAGLGLNGPVPRWKHPRPEPFMELTSVNSRHGDNFCDPCRVAHSWGFGDDLVTGFDLDGVEAVAGQDRLLGASAGGGFEPAGDCEAVKTMVGWASIEAVLGVGRAGAEIGLGLPERLSPRQPPGLRTTRKPVVNAISAPKLATLTQVRIHGHAAPCGVSGREVAISPCCTVVGRRVRCGGWCGKTSFR